MTSRSYTLRRLVSRLSVGLIQAALAVALCVFVLSVSAPATFAQEKGKMVSFDIPAGDAVKALKQFSAQSGQQLLYSNEDLAGVNTNAVKGRLGVQEALDRLLAKTPLAASRDDSNGAVAVGRKVDPNAQRLAQKSSDQPIDQKSDIKDGVLKLDTFEVMGSKLLNMDIKRSENDAQPYVIYEKQAIAESGATDLEEFLKKRLTMDSAGATGQQGAIARGLSFINLRGLGVNQTLILIDGRRIASPSLQGLPLQPDINNIPLAAIERVEVLPTTASGIYGGNATGGVINIVLRKDYDGGEIKFTYDNSFESDTAIRRVDISSGFTLEGGKTNILITASYGEANQLHLQDRSFRARGLRNILQNYPSAIFDYVVPPIGATPNIRSASGANLTLADGTPLNSFRTSVPYGYAGPSSDGGAALVARAGTYNLDLADTAQPAGKRWDLLGGSKIENMLATVRRQFSPAFQAYIDMAASNSWQYHHANSAGFFFVPAGVPGNPFAQDVYVQAPVPEADTDTKFVNFNRRATVGFILKLPLEWNAAGDYTWNRATLDNGSNALTTLSAADPAVAAGNPNIFRDPSVAPYNFGSLVGPFTFFLAPFKSTFGDASLRLSGPVGHMPGGSPIISALLSHRREDFGAGTLSNGGTLLFYPSKSQAVTSGYLEAFLPLISKENRKSGIEALGIQLAGRQDNYTIHGTNSALRTTTPLITATNRTRSINPTVGVKYQPTEDFMVRASYGTGFVPPSVFQLAPLVTNPQGPLDPKRGNTRAPHITQTSGGNPNLGPEKSKSWSAGIVYTPRGVPGIRVSIDYVRIEKTNNIATLSAQDIVNNEALFPGRVIRAALPPGDIYSAGPITNLDASAVNISGAKLEAYDFSVGYKKDAYQLGEFELLAGLTLTPHYKTQIIASQPWVETVGIEGAFNSVLSPGTTLKYKANAGLTWKREQWSVGWSTSYYDSYLVADPNVASNQVTLLSQGNGGKVSSQMYHDVFVSYRFKPETRSFGHAALNGMEIQATVKNVFNTKPPFDAGSELLGSYYSGFGDPRLASYQLTLKKTF